MNAIHCFEAAGLGKAPFTYDGVVYQEIAYGNRVVNLKGANGQIVQCETKPGGTCDYCGTYIVNMFKIKSSDGRTFKVGCDCLMKTGDSGLIRIVNDEIKAMERKRRQARKIAKETADKQTCEDARAAGFNGFNSAPHPIPHHAHDGRTMADYLRWLVDNRCYAKAAGIIRSSH